MSFNKKVTFIIDAQDNATDKVKKLSAETAKLKTTTDNQAKAAKSAGSTALSLGNIYRTLAYGSLAMLTKKVLENASSMEQNRIAFETMLGSAEQAQILLGRLSDFARKTPFNLPELVEGTKKLLAYGTAANEVIPTMNALGNIAAGVGREKLPQLILAFGQVQTATKLTGMELRQFTEAGVPLLDALSKQSGKSAAQIKKDMEDGAAPSFNEVRKAVFAMSEDGGKFFDLMAKQSQTLGGQLSNLQDNLFRLGNAVVGVSETGTIIQGSFFDVVRNGIFGVNDGLDKNYTKIVTWGSAIVNSFYALGRTLANAVTLIAKIIVSPIQIAVAGVYDAIAIIKSWLAGDFSVSMVNLQSSIDVITEGIVGDATDMASSWLEASGAVDASSRSMATDMGELSGASNALANDLSADTDKMASKMKDFADKISDAKKKLKDLKHEYKESRKELKEELKETLEQQKKNLGENIAQKLYDNEEELTKLKEDLLVEETDERKLELENQITAIEKFLDEHKTDYMTYSSELKALREYNALDEIEQLKVDYEQKRKETIKQYEEELDDLKDQYKKRKKELKEHLDDIKDELKDFLKSKTVQKFGDLFGLDVSIPGKAIGGPVVSGQSYVVGERGPEMFIPNQSGTIIPADKTSSGATFNFTFNGDVSDKSQLIAEIKQAINRELELSRYGIG